MRSVVLRLTTLVVFLGMLPVNSQTFLRGIVLDQKTQQPVQNAKFGISNQGVGVFTNPKGQFTYRKYHHILSDNSTFKISAEGYRTLLGNAELLRKLRNKKGIIYLQKRNEAEAITKTSAPTISIIWDASLPLRSRNVDAEIEFLREYLVNKNDHTIVLTVFNESLLIKNNFEVTESRLQLLESMLTDIEFEGISDASIPQFGSATEVLLFSGQRPAFGTFDIDQDIPITIVNSSLHTESDVYFEAISNFTSGNYIKLRSTDKVAQELISQSALTIKGALSNPSGPVPFALITKTGSLNEFLADGEGNFEIPATEGDELMIYSLGNYPKKVTITTENWYDVKIVPRVEQLETVTLRKRKERSNYAFDSILQMDIVEGRSVPIRSIHKSQFNLGAMNLGEAIDGLYGAQAYFSPQTGQTFMSVKGKCARVFIDGVEGSVNSIPIRLVENISVYAAYGSVIPCAARIIVTTRMHPDRVDMDLRRRGMEPLENNYYTETVQELDFNIQKERYFSELWQDQPLSEQFERYEDLQLENMYSVDFYVTMALYFQTLDTGLARRIRSDFALIAKENVKALRILAYLNEQAGAYTMAQKIYERILEMAPSEPQSYRDVALIFQETGAYDKALELYINMLGDQIPGVNFAALDRILSNELQRLINRHKQRIAYQRLHNDWLLTDFNIDIRITASWSDANAPFEFQFVNPEKRFFNWNSDTIEDSRIAKTNGTEEFVIDDATPGEWLVNVRYTGEEGALTIPPYLKYTLYKDYGTPKEQKTIKVVRLNTLLDKATLDSFTY